MSTTQQAIQDALSEIEEERESAKEAHATTDLTDPNHPRYKGMMQGLDLAKRILLRHLEKVEAGASES